MNDETVNIDTFVENNRDAIVRVLRHSHSAYARACAWTLLDHASDDPQIEELERELRQLKKQREARA